MKKSSLKDLKKNADSVLNKDELRSISGGHQGCDPGLGYNITGVSVRCLDYNNYPLGIVCATYGTAYSDPSPICADEAFMENACRDVYGFANVNHGYCYDI